MPQIVQPPRIPAGPTVPPAGKSATKSVRRIRPIVPNVFKPVSH